MLNNVDEVVSGGKIKSFAGALEFAFKKIASLDFLIIFRVTVLLMIIVAIIKLSYQMLIQLMNLYMD